MGKLLFVTASDVGNPRGGRALLSALHFRTMVDLLGDEVVLFRLMPARTPAVQSLRGFVDGVTPASVEQIVARVATEGFDRVWLDGSNLGVLAAAIRRRVPTATVFSFFHNVEARFFWGAFRHAPRARSLAVLVANYLAERHAVRSSVRIVALSERDSSGLAHLYGRSATDILPMAIADEADPGKTPGGPIAADAPLLFVGGSFYANRAGVAWFARQVARRANARTIVVGHGMDVMRDDLADVSEVEIVGSVDRLEPFYRQARVAIAPIFDGSGMKTKVAEALMFGRPVIGTPEAFSGYETVADRAGWVCRTAEEFLAAIADAKARPLTSFDPALRALYDQHHSVAATRQRLAAILGR